MYTIVVIILLGLTAFGMSLLTKKTNTSSLTTTKSETTLTGRWKNDQGFEVALLPDGKYFARFCNNVSGSYVFDTRTVTFSGGISTLMFCEGPAGQIESALAQKPWDYKIIDQSGVMTLEMVQQESGQTLVFTRAKFQESVQNPSGTAWEIVFDDNSRMGFDFSDTTLTVQTTCGVYTGTYTKQQKNIEYLNEPTDVLSADLTNSEAGKTCTDVRVADMVEMFTDGGYVYNPNVDVDSLMITSVNGIKQSLSNQLILTRVK